MILIPYFWDTSNPNWIRFGIFLCSGGRSLWEVEQSEIEEILEENGFPLLSMNTIDKTIYAKIDPTINISNFYMWDDVNYKTTDLDVWRITKIPVALWSCEIFKQYFWKSVNLPEGTELGLRAAE
jgi:hypothetical protein